MAEEVEIGNVGGTTGVASEVTLVRLVAAMEKMAGVKGADPAKMKKIMEDNHKAISDANYQQKQLTKEKEKATDKTSRFGKAVTGAAKALTAMTGAIAGQLMGSVVNFADALLKGKTDLKDFTSAIPFVGGYLGVFAGIIDTNIAAFRALSTSGAIFGQGLNDLRIKAAQAGVPLDMFVGMITENSERMRLFGGTTATAGQQFSLFSRQFRSGAGRDLINLGFTVADLNELILDYAEYQDRIFGTDRRNRKISQEEVAAYGEELMRLSAVTGKQRKAIAEELNAKMEDVRNTQAISRMNKQQQENFRAATAISASLGPNMSEAITDMVDGIPSKGSVAEGLMVVSETFRAKAGELKNMNLEEQMAFFDAVKNEVEARAGSFTEPAFQAILNAGGPLAEALKTQSELAQFTNADMETELENLRARIETEKQVDEATKGFQDTIFELQSTFNKIFFEPGGPLDDISSAFNTLAGNLSKEPLKTQFANTIQKVADTFGILTSKLETLISDISNFGFKAAFMGQKEIKDDQGNIIQQEVKGLFGNAGELGIGSLIADLLGNAMKSLFGDINWGGIAIGGGLGAAGLAALFLLPLTGPIGIIAALTTALIGIGTVAYFSGAFDPALEAISGWATSIGQSISDSWDATKNTVTEAWSTAKNNVVAIGTSISDGWDSTKSAVATQWDTAKQRVSALGSRIADTWDQTKAGIATKWDSAKVAVSGIGDAIKNKFNDIDLSGFSWKEQFQNIWDAITGFFNFDFKLPNFRDFLPTWLGGSGKTIEDSADGPNQSNLPDATDAVNKSNKVTDATAAIANLIDIPSLKNALAVIKDGMDSVQVETYADALASVAEQLTAINEAAQDQEITVNSRRGTKTVRQTSAAANMLNSVGDQNAGSAQMATLNTTMRDVLTELQAINKHTKATAKNDSNVANSVTINN